MVALYLAVQLLRMNLNPSSLTVLQSGSGLGCHVLSANLNGRYLLLSETLLATVFFLMSVVNLIKTSRLTRAGMRDVSPFFTAFVRDCAMFYFAHMVALIVVLVLSIVINGPLVVLCIILLVPTYSFSTSRLILNPRVFAARQRRGYVTWDGMRVNPNRGSIATATTNNDRPTERGQDESPELPIELGLLQ
ncbi:hypothetical protein AX15_005605 [Amanita polypyramis BW_CC]|nr:hypothetical protein AX15_005605 [Amanita polypyramis BW_CC]